MEIDVKSLGIGAAVAIGAYLLYTKSRGMAGPPVPVALPPVGMNPAMLPPPPPTHDLHPDDATIFATRLADAHVAPDTDTSWREDVLLMTGHDLDKLGAPPNPDTVVRATDYLASKNIQALRTEAYPSRNMMIADLARAVRHEASAITPEPIVAPPPPPPPPVTPTPPAETTPITSQPVRNEHRISDWVRAQITPEAAKDFDTVPVIDDPQWTTRIKSYLAHALDVLHAPANDDTSARATALLQSMSLPLPADTLSQNEKLWLVTRDIVTMSIPSPIIATQ